MKRILCILLLAALFLQIPFPAVLAEETPVIKVLDPADIPPNPKGMHHYLLFCMDSWQANLRRLGYSDGMVLLSIDEATGRVMVTSFIRDMLVMHPDNHPGRLTYIVKKFGPQGLVDTINRHFGIKIEKYLMMDWSQVQAIVDAVGGVDITITSAEAVYLRNYALAPSSTIPALQYAGTYHFKGHSAVIYMRMRKVPAINGETQDFGRTYRSRTVLNNIAKSLQNVSYQDALKLLDAVIQNTLQTNMTAADMLEALNMAFALKSSKIEPFRLPVDKSYRLFIYAGGDAQLMDFEKNRVALSAFLYNTGFVVQDP